MKRLVLFLLCTPLLAMSQVNYIPASIIKNNGETVKGFINYYPKWEETPQYIEFKVDIADNRGQTYSPAQLKSFQLKGIEYIAFSGIISMNKNRFPDIASSPDSSTIQTDIFLKIVYQGLNLGLFSQTDKLKTRYFIGEGNTVPQELKYYFYFDSVQNIDREIASYKSQLAVLAQKYHHLDASMIKKLKVMPFEEDKLKKVVKFIDQPIVPVQ